MSIDATYEGWANRATWNVALWIQNDEPLYRAAVSFMKGYKGPRPYSAFIKSMGMNRERTPDNFKWLGPNLDHKELNEMMREFSPEGTQA